MKIIYTISDNVLSRRVDENGSPLHTHEVFIYEAVKRVLFEKFTKEFSLSDFENVLLKSQEEAEKRILRLNQWIDCFTLIKSKNEIESIIKQSSESYASFDSTDINKTKLIDINNRLLGFKKQEKDILVCLQKHNKTIQEVSPRWIAESLPNFYPFNQDKEEFS